MNIPLLIANGLIFLTFAIHTFMGDRELGAIEPPPEDIPKREKWLMARGAFHIVSADFLLATVGLALVNFTTYFTDKLLILQLLTLYFSAYGLAFLLALVISKKLPNKFIMLGQWLLMFVIAGLIYYGTP